MDLFRSEALRAQERLHGEASMAPPTSWQALGAFLGLSTVAAAAFLVMGTYTRSTTVRGELAGTTGVTRIVSPRTGTISRILAGEGQAVRTGQPLVVVSLDVDDGSGGARQRRSDALAREDSILASRSRQLRGETSSRIAALEAQAEGASAQSASLRDQVSQQEDMIRSASEELDRVHEVAKRGFVSAHDVRERENDLATKRQGLSRLRQEIAAQAAQAASARAQIAEARGDLDVQTSEAERSRIQISGSASDDAALRSITLRAPTDGVVTGVAQHVGDQTSADVPVMSVVPSGGRLEALLAVPPGSAGRISRGQRVSVEMDAFPYQTHGAIPGTVVSSSSAAVPVRRPDGSHADAFVVHVALAASTIPTPDGAATLRPGMGVTARIRSERRTLLQWLLGPALAMSRR